jgi:hypothetical protein
VAELSACDEIRTKKRTGGMIFLNTLARLADSSWMKGRISNFAIPAALSKAVSSLRA